MEPIRKLYKKSTGSSHMDQIAKSAMFEALERVSDKKVLVLGDAIVDEYVYCTEAGTSLSSPGTPKLRCERKEVYRGGAGNVAENLLALGARVSLITLLGDDLARSHYCAWNNPNLHLYPIIEKRRKTNVKTRYCVGDRKVLAVEDLDVRDIREDSEQAVLDAMQGENGKSDAVIFQDQCHGFFSPNLISRLRSVLGEDKRKVLVNSQTYLLGPRHRKYAGFGTITMNLKEARAIDETFDGSEGNKLVNALDSDVCVTLGEKGATLYRGNQKYNAPGMPIKPIDTCGAGDAFLAAFSVFDFETNPLMSLQMANIWAGLSAQKMGTSVPNIRELENYIERATLQ